MLVVDPVKRITVAEIRQLPWFQQNLPAYLQPLPPTPAAETSGFDFDMSTNNPEAKKGEEDEVDARGVAPDIGILEDEIMTELADKMAGFSVDELRERLLEPEENQVKVAYHLVRDHKRMVQMSHLDENKEMEAFLAQDPPPWNAGLDNGGGTARSTSIRRKPRDGGSRTRTSTISHGAMETSLADESTMSEQDGGNATDEVATEGFASEDEDLISATDEDETGLFTEDDEVDESIHAQSYSIAVLKSSIPGVRADETPSSEVGPAAPLISVTSSARRSRNRWHFGIRSRSPPMEIMLELYRTLQVLGMEWRAKPQDEKEREENAKEADKKADSTKNTNDKHEDSNRGEDLFFIETRWKVDDIIARMNLQLYRVDESNYLVDFRNVGYVRMQTTQDGDLDSNVVSPINVEGDVNDNNNNEFSPKASAGIHEALDRSNNNIKNAGDQAAISDPLAPSSRKAGTGTSTNNQHVTTNAAAEGRKEVCSPFLFLECATRLIIELAGGG